MICPEKAGILGADCNGSSILSSLSQKALQKEVAMSCIDVGLLAVTSIEAVASRLEGAIQAEIFPRDLQDVTPNPLKLEGGNTLGDVL